MKALLGIILFILLQSCSSSNTEFSSSWHKDHDRHWLSENFWGNRLQDWKVTSGKLTCVEKRFLGMRTAHLLKYRLNSSSNDFNCEVKLALLDSSSIAGDGSGGFLLGAGNGIMNTKAAAIIHEFYGKGFGIIAGIGVDGKLFIHDAEKGPYKKEALTASEAINRDITLKLKATAVGDSYKLTLNASGTNGVIPPVSATFPAERLRGNIGLFSHPGLKAPKSKKLKGRKAAQYSFDNFKINGAKLTATQNSTLGAIISTQYTLSRDIMKITAQLMPIASDDATSCRLEIKKNGKWLKIADSKIQLPSYTAPFRIKNWDSDKDIDYRICCDISYRDGSQRTFSRQGTIRKDPKDKKKVTVAGFTGNHNNSHSIGGGWGSKGSAKNNWISGMWFPHNDMTEKVLMHKPDVIFFSGDQVYEGKSPSFADRTHIKMDYLYKWYMWCWAYRDMVRDLPCICLPDDHDVYQGNIWGAGGRKAKTQNHGGYVHPADFVKMVDRTQTSHLPDPYDPTQIDQGINVYYTDMVYGRISFAIIEDRKFKSGPLQSAMPNTGTHRPDHFNNPNFDVTRLDLKGLTLLGDRQLNFIDDWTQDWKGADMKVLLSQTVFGNMATHHGGTAEGNRLIADLDSNGWPQTGRNKAIRALRKGYAFHLAGDQHLATVVHHGVDEHRDGIWSFCVPSVANFYPRKWHPLVEGKNRPVGSPSWQGDHRDGFRNKVTVFAAANPGKSYGKQPLDLHDKMAGYGIVTLDREARSIKMECWPRWSVPGTDPQYKGWPKTISQFDNYGRVAKAWLPEIHCNKENPVIQVINEQSGEVVYTVRAKGTKFTPKVFAAGQYSIKVSLPELSKEKTLNSIKASTQKGKVIDIRF